MKQFFEKMFFAPKWYHFPLILILSPLSLLYGIGMGLRRALASKVDFGIPIVSVGNLIVGGSGKTPFVIALASRFEGVAIISRGYGRLSSGLVEVSCEGAVLVDVDKSGDEAMLMAKSLPKASVIVSEDRHAAIKMAKEKGAKLIILDDGFNRVSIEKYEVILEPQTIKNYLPFPAGAFREFFFTSRYADVIAKEGRDFERVVEVQNATKGMVLVTAISNPERLDVYLPSNVLAKVTYDDHAYFDEEVLLTLLEENKADSILCTSKDKVKMQGFKLAISEMKLKLEINNEIFEKIETYIEGYTSAR
jgi:tetraacyldisaccharide 4'-kinase